MSDNESDNGKSFSKGGDRGPREGSDDKQKPRERYIPPAPTEDENEMFSSGISSGINFDKYDKINIKVTGENVPRQINSFEECGLRELVRQNVKKSGYKRPTPVQKYAIPIVIGGRDLMACAQTGSGKTAAFLLPIVNELIANPTDLIVESDYVEPQAVIVSPTRELTLQIFEEARKFAHSSIIKTAICYGGTVVYHQEQQLMRGCHILVATPGRLNDFVSRGRLRFNSVRFFVLDEADRMLDMGFLPAVERMLTHESMVETGVRQTLMFSATFPEEIQMLAKQYLSNYLFLAVGVVGGACADVEQTVHQVSKFDKRTKLIEILKENTNNELSLVFVETKRSADFLAAFLSENDFPTTSIHGDRMQSQREQALKDFKCGRMPTLVATAVAARGLDIKNVSHVINYDMPSSIDEYVHRIGRTGRVGNRGKASSFFDTDQDNALARDLMKILEQADQEVPAFLSNAAGGGGGDYSSSFSRNNNFGGRDIRKGEPKSDFISQGNQPQALEEEEEW